MSLSTISVAPYDSVGAEVRGLDLCRVDARWFAHLLELWWEHAVLVFPGAGLDEAEQVAFSRRFGRLERLTSRARAAALGPRAEIGTVTNLDRWGTPVPAGSSLDRFLSGNRRWHSDSSFKAVPAKASLLSARVVPSVGGETEWADARAAYDALASTERRALAALSAVHSYRESQGMVGGTDVLPAQDWAELVDVTHPVVRRHPDSGRRSLFVGRHAVRVVGWPAEPGRDLLAGLTDFVGRPERVHTHRWAAGDLVLWDNRCVLHRVREWPSGEARVMTRTTVAGDGPNEWALEDPPDATSGTACEGRLC
ncbi:MAG: TauD/TfdA family dioxygenase [Acidimicrobiia bacterium]|nr:TauD/TfdA family dioxygenase [Acidimicrobiia bacterium]